MLSDQLDQDLKSSLLAHDAVRTSTLRGLKSALTYASVEDKSRGGSGDLGDEQIAVIFSREAKKRQESADAFTKGGAKDRAEKELAEKKIIEGYLPSQLTDEALAELVDRAIQDIGSRDPRQMGEVMTRVKAAAGLQADGARIAGLVKERLQGNQ